MIWNEDLEIGASVDTCWVQIGKNYLTTFGVCLFAEARSQRHAKLLGYCNNSEHMCLVPDMFLH